MNLTVFTKTSHRQLKEGHCGQQSSGHPPCQDLDLYRMHMAWGSPAWCCVHTKLSTKFNGAKAISWLLVIENSKTISVKYVPQPCCLKQRGQCLGHAPSPAFTKPLHPILPQFRSSQAKTERECFFEIAQIYVYIYENCNIAFCKESLGQTAQVFGQQLIPSREPRVQPQEVQSITVRHFCQQNRLFIFFAAQPWLAVSAPARHLQARQMSSMCSDCLN